MWIRMVFNSSSLIIGIFIGLIVWLGIISVLLIRTISHYNRLTKGITQAGLTEVLQAIVDLLHTLQGRTAETEKKLTVLGKEGRVHFQRIGVVRFNPFADTGGAQSFTIALLNQDNSGIVMTSLYARAGNRWYVKEIAAGKGKGMELSKEESAAIEKAKHAEIPSYE